MFYYIFAVWLLIINITALAAYGIDKRRAVKHRWRIPESTLIGLAVLGGSIGAYAGMKIFRHKTRHNIFRIGVPVVMAVQLLILFSLLLVHHA